MLANLQTLGIDRLSVSERLILIEQIWNSLPEEIASDEIPEWHTEELAKRLGEAESKLQAGRPWREVLDGLGTNS